MQKLLMWVWETQVLCLWLVHLGPQNQHFLVSKGISVNDCFPGSYILLFFLLLNPRARSTLKCDLKNNVVIPPSLKSRNDIFNITSSNAESSSALENYQTDWDLRNAELIFSLCPLKMQPKRHHTKRKHHSRHSSQRNEPLHARATDAAPVKKK